MRNAKKDKLAMKARQELMIEEGFRLFSDRGIESAGMQEVADACHLGIATLYRYYGSKLSLVLDIGVKKWEEYADHIREQQLKQNVGSMNAAQELAFYLDFYMDMYKSHRSLLRFNQYFNNYVQHEGATRKQLEPYLASINALKRMFCAIYEKGKKDGTIRTDMSVDKMFASTSHIMMAVGVRYAQGLIYDGENETDRTEEYALLKRMILREFVL